MTQPFGSVSLGFSDLSSGICHLPTVNREGLPKQSYLNAAATMSTRFDEVVEFALQYSMLHASAKQML